MLERRYDAALGAPRDREPVVGFFGDRLPVQVEPAADAGTIGPDLIDAGLRRGGRVILIFVHVVRSSVLP